VRKSFIELEGQPQQVYVWRIPPGFIGLVEPAGANNVLIEVLRAESCEVVATHESDQDELGVVVAENASVSFSSDRAERGFDDGDDPLLPQLVTDCGGEHT
jgi:hypothetical protein